MGTLQRYGASHTSHDALSTCSCTSATWRGEYITLDTLNPQINTLRTMLQANYRRVWISKVDCTQPNCRHVVPQYDIQDMSSRGHDDL